MTNLQTFENTYNTLKDFYKKASETNMVNIKEVDNLLKLLSETPDFYEVDEEIAKTYNCSSLSEVEEKGLLTYEDVKKIDKLYEMHETMIDLERHLTSLQEQLKQVTWFGGVL